MLIRILVGPFYWELVITSKAVKNSAQDSFKQLILVPAVLLSSERPLMVRLCSVIHPWQTQASNTVRNISSRRFITTDMLVKS